MNQWSGAPRATVLAFTTLVASAPIACGGSKGKGDALRPANAPEWVARGSRVQTGSIFGVGSAAGIANTPLARDTASNRGRAEISRILEVYSASLMKDYMASTSANGANSEEQHVEQAIKTFSANLMNGTEVKDYFLDPAANTWYALVELNFERAREVAAAQAQMGPGLRKWVDENGDDVLKGMDQGGGPPPATESEADNDSPPPAAPPVASNPPPAAPPAADGPPAKVGGAAPGWTQGQCDRARYLCGVGDGPDRKTADNDSRAELARIFVSNIQAVTTAFQGAASTISNKTGEQWIEVQRVSDFSMVSTNKVVTMSQIVERWSDGKGREWSLAVIDRVQASNALRQQIEQKDGIVESALGRAQETEDKLNRYKSLKTALQALMEREAMNGDLRVIQANGEGIPAPHSIGDILALLDTAAADLSFGVALSGSGAERVRSCLEDALTQKGYQIQANVDEEEEDEISINGSFDVLIKGNVKAAKRGQIAGSEVVETTLTLKLINGKTNKILRTITGSEKGSRGDVKSAAATSAFKICQKKVPEMVKDIDKYFAK